MSSMKVWAGDVLGRRVLRGMMECGFMTSCCVND